MQGYTVHWAGVPFLPVFHHDGGFFRQPGVYAFVHRVGGHRTLLYVGHTDNIAISLPGHRLWAQALTLGFNELDVCLKAAERTDRLILTGHIVKRCGPLLNVLEEQAGTQGVRPVEAPCSSAAAADVSPVNAPAARPARLGSGR